jgi:hypothetical protein
MTYIGWALALVLALVMVGGGVLKLIWDKKRIDSSLEWTDSFSTWQVKVIGVVEVGLGGALVVSLVFRADRWVGLASVALTGVMIGAVITHIARKDPAGKIMPAAVIGVLFAALAVTALS